MTELRVLPPALGNYAAGDRFWDREREVKDIVAYLSGGQGVLITGPRRIGKTSVVHRVLGTLDPSMNAVFVDVEGCATPTELFAGVAAAASADAGSWRRIRRWFGKRLGDTVDRIAKVDVWVLKVELQAAMAGSWHDDARAVIRALAEGDHPTVVAVDELPLLVDRVLKRDAAEAELLMATLRGLAEEFRSVRWLVSGSIGLEPILHRAGLTGLITHLRSYPVDGWDAATTEGAVEALARATDLVLDAGAARSVHARLGLGVPYHVQLLVDEVRRDADRRGNRRVSADDVSRVYEGPFLASAAVVGNLTSSDATLLAEDLVEDASQRPALLREVLEILEHDAYLGRAPDGWHFRSRLVRDWWRQSNEMGFVPATSRKPSGGGPPS